MKPVEFLGEVRVMSIEEKENVAHENLSCLPTVLCMAQKVGQGLE